MLEFLGAAENMPFSVAIGVMFGLAVLEGVGLLMGAGLSQLLDSLLPEFDADLDLDVDADLDMDTDLDVDADADVDGGDLHGPGAFAQILGWFHIGRVPLLVVLVLFLMSFGVIGLAIQSTVGELTGHLLPAALASVPAFLGAVPVVRVVGGLIARLIPKEETSAVSQRTFIGRVAVVVLGTARAGEPAQARLRDEYGRSHYVMVEPDVAGEEFATGEEVLLVKSAGARFRGIRPPSEALVGD